MTGNLFSSLLCSLWWVPIFGYVLACRSYSFVCTVHHLIIIIVQTYLKALNLSNSCQIYFVECLSKIKHILSVIHYTICGAVCFQFTHLCCDDWDDIYTLSYYHHQIGIMNYNPCIELRWRFPTHKSGLNGFRVVLSGTQICSDSNTLWFVAVNEALVTLTHWGRDKMAAIFQTTFSNAFSRMKMYEFRLRFQWSLFLRVQLIIFQHCCR